MATDPIRLVEVKARCPDVAAARQWLDAHAVPVDDVTQVDTYFRVARGRLKLREVEGRPAQLIWYEREDVPGPKRSRVRLARVPEGPPLRRLLTEALGVAGTVRKRRQAYRWEGVRVHLDEVEGLGPFLEFERRWTTPEEEQQAREEVRALGEVLGVAPEDRVAGSYRDLLRRAP